jgi:hypothetical protein
MGDRELTVLSPRQKKYFEADSERVAASQTVPRERGKAPLASA